jgi:hypothetical protein
MIKVRFHLGAGPNHGKWQIINGQSRIYIKPDGCRIVLSGCTLKNRKSTAKRIFEGAHKTVCAWIEAEHGDYSVVGDGGRTEWAKGPLFYNPRISPNWTDSHGADLDNLFFPVILIEGRKVSYLIDIR